MSAVSYKKNEYKRTSSELLGLNRPPTVACSASIENSGVSIFCCSLYAFMTSGFSK